MNQDDQDFFANTAVTVYALSVYDDTTQMGSFMPITQAVASSMSGIRASDIQLLLHWVQIDDTVPYKGMDGLDEMPDNLQKWMEESVPELVRKVQADMQDSARTPPNRMVFLDAPMPMCAAIGTMLRDAGITRFITKHRHGLRKKNYWRVENMAVDESNPPPTKHVMINTTHPPLVHDEENQATGDDYFLVSLDTAFASTYPYKPSDLQQWYTKDVERRLARPYRIAEYITYQLKDAIFRPAFPKEVVCVTREALEKVPEGCTLVMLMNGRGTWACSNAYAMGMQVRRADFFTHPIVYMMRHLNGSRTVILQ